MFTMYPQRVMVDLKDIKDSRSTGSTSPMGELVSAIRENLILKAPVSLTSCKCGLGSQKASRRVSPYNISSRENHVRRSAECTCRRNSSPRNGEQENPYELLQALLKQGTLISEAVRRLQAANPQKSSRKSSPRILRSPSSVDSCVSDCDSQNFVACGTT